MTSTSKVASTVLVVAVLQLLQICHALSASDCLSSFCKVQLSKDLTLQYKINIPEDYDPTNTEDECKTCKIEGQLSYDGYAWLGIGLSQDGEMEGSHAIIGQPNIKTPTSYYLADMDINAIKEVSTRIENPNIDYVDGYTVMDFTISFADWGGAGTSFKSPALISLKSPTTFIWAHGDEGVGEMQYHGPNNKASHTIENLSVMTEQSLQGMTMQTTKVKSNKSAWLAHGIMAFLAWGICAPIAITTAILRDLCLPKVPARLKGLISKLQENWLIIHISLNTLVCAITMLVFTVAVLNINHESGYHFGYAHSNMGLAMFILAFNQVLSGYLRPSPNVTVPKNGEENNSTEENGEDGIDNENGEEQHNILPMKTTIRQAWELFHNVLGIALFLFGVWQMYEGIDLYHMRYENSSVGAVFGFYILWMAIWCVAIVGGTTYKWYIQVKGLDGDSNKAVELPDQTQVPVPDDDTKIVDTGEFS